MQRPGEILCRMGPTMWMEGDPPTIRGIVIESSTESPVQLHCCQYTYNAQEIDSKIVWHFKLRMH